MAEKKKQGLGASLVSWLTLGLSLFNLAQKITRIIKAEIHLAVNSLITLIIASVFCGIILAAVWFGLLSILYLYLLSLKLSMTIALCIIILLNLILLLLLIFLMQKAKRHLFFPCSRKQLELLKKLADDEC